MNIKLRVWDKYLSRFHYPKLSGYFSCEGRPSWGMDGECGNYSGYEDNFDKNFVFQQFTGLKDKNGQEVYEGDIVKFRYWVGDFAWEEMDAEERERNCRMLDKQFIGVVQRDLIGSINLEIRSGNTYFPIGYLTNAEIIGNIFENAELLR